MDLIKFREWEDRDYPEADVMLTSPYDLGDLCIMAQYHKMGIVIVDDSRSIEDCKVAQVRKLD